MQAITTIHLPATDKRGERIRAQTQASSLTVDWDHGLNSDQNHVAAAKALAQKLEWNYGTWYGGGLPPGNGCCFVCAEPRSHLSFTL